MRGQRVRLIHRPLTRLASLSLRLATLSLKGRGEASARLARSAQSAHEASRAQPPSFSRAVSPEVCGSRAAPHIRKRRGERGAERRLYAVSAFALAGYGGRASCAEARRLSAHRLRRSCQVAGAVLPGSQQAARATDPDGFRRRSLRRVQPFKADPRSGVGRLSRHLPGAGYEPARGRRANLAFGLAPQPGPTGQVPHLRHRPPPLPPSGSSLEDAPRIEARQ